MQLLKYQVVAFYFLLFFRPFFAKCFSNVTVISRNKVSAFRKDSNPQIFRTFLFPQGDKKRVTGLAGLLPASLLINYL